MLTENTYRKLIASYRGNNLLEDIPGRLVPLWCDDYCLTNPKAELFSVDLNSLGTSFTYLFDLSLERTIAAYGEPIFAKHRRDAGRMAGHPLSAGAEFHRGHLIAHSLGGGTDINLVPQLSRLNIGAFRVLERRVRDLAMQNQKCLYFVRPVYTSESQTPALFEQCAIFASKAITYFLHKNS